MQCTLIVNTNNREGYLQIGFFSGLLDEDYLFEAVRYVELNPFEARMESASRTYMRSSAQERLGLIKTRFYMCLIDLIIKK